jgi:hypothetical protein
MDLTSYQSISHVFFHAETTNLIVGSLAGSMEPIYFYTTSIYFLEDYAFFLRASTKSKLA